MAKVNLRRLSVGDLARLRDDVQAALSKRISTARGELQNQIDKLAIFERTSAVSGSNGRRNGKANGVHRVSTSRSPQVKIRKKATPKYRGPKGELWAGRGLAPRWLTALEQKGKKRESFLISR